MGTASSLPGVGYLVPSRDDWMPEPFAQVGLAVTFGKDLRGIELVTGFAF